MTENLILRNIEKRSALIRLTALWALNEAALGGILHLFRSPFTGIVVGGTAVVIICLMAHISDNPMVDIPKALILVLIIKVSLSPHTPITAHLSVAFQGLLGACLFSYLSSFRLAALLLAVLALLQSVFQKLLVMTIILGLPFWESLDNFINHILGKLGWASNNPDFSGSLWLVSLYAGVYLLAGIIIGYYAGILPRHLDANMADIVLPKKEEITSYKIVDRVKASSFNIKKVLLLLFAASFLGFSYFLVPENMQMFEPVVLIMRFVAGMILWYLLITPILLKLFYNFINKKSEEYQNEVAEAMALIPIFKQLVMHAWRESKGFSGFNKLKHLGLRIITYSLYFRAE